MRFGKFTTNLCTYIQSHLHNISFSLLRGDTHTANRAPGRHDAAVIQGHLHFQRSRSARTLVKCISGSKRISGASHTCVRCDGEYERCNDICMYLGQAYPVRRGKFGIGDRVRSFVSIRLPSHSTLQQDVLVAANGGRTIATCYWVGQKAIALFSNRWTYVSWDATNFILKRRFIMWFDTADGSSLFQKEKAHDFVDNRLFGVDPKVENQKKHFRHILLLYLRKGRNVVRAHKKLCNGYGEDALKQWSELVCKTRLEL